MFTQTARYYDKFYSFKDYAAETEQLLALIIQRCRSGGKHLLDVACGTGRHIEHLKAHFAVQGLDLDPALLETARQRNPEITFHLGDMVDFELGLTFDVVTCLFSSIGYVRTLANLNRAVNCMAAHLKPGGLLVVEPWFTPGDWHSGTPHAMLIDEPELKIARLNTSFADGRLSYFDFHYLIATPQGTEHLVERHELGLFERDEMRTALLQADLEVSYDGKGLTGRGLWVGQKPKAQDRMDAPTVLR
jgi:SAM-dependent methyltransferase